MKVNPYWYSNNEKKTCCKRRYVELIMNCSDVSKLASNSTPKYSTFTYFTLETETKIMIMKQFCIVS